MRQRTITITLERLEQLRQMRYHDYLRTPECMRKRYGALMRAGHRCQICNSNHSLRIHHRSYERLGCELLSDNLVMCSECHELFHKHRWLVRVEEVRT